MIQPILVLLFKLQKWHEWMIIDTGDPTGREANRDVSQGFVKFGMGGLDDGEGIRGYGFDWVLLVLHWVEKGRGSIRGLGKQGESEIDVNRRYFYYREVNDLIFDLIGEKAEGFEYGGALYKEKYLSDICLPDFSETFTTLVSGEKYRIHSSMMAGF